MSLLNLTNDGLPNVLVVLYAAVARSRSTMSRDELLESVSPAGVVDDDGKMARQTLNRWTELGLFRDDGSAISLAQPPSREWRDEREFLASVRSAARRCALSEANNGDLWAHENAKAADLTRSLAWLLAQDVYRTTFSSLEDLELKQIADPEARLMRNDTRRNGLQVWGHFLGFVHQPGGGDIDPTTAVREVLNDCIQPGEDMPAVTLIERLAESLPVLDGGGWRRAVEARLSSQALPTMAEGQLSTSLSRALIGLLLEEELRFENRADVGSSIVFTGRDGLRSDYRYSWVRRAKPILGGKGR
ncbi:protein DpdG [Solimonas sp. SE-A11]|uniref:protein DpdG n=1 Tax=Solimonas sp. SE-A11 TaxID=3054954 RepID=UPI00259CB0C3|nr:protein DpdG [Solimonas sp. SE-A11]MDM4769071.1 protein DpdG [Solimonas sp. SE-A11]